MNKRLFAVVLLGLVSSCSFIATLSLEQRYGQPKPQEREIAALKPSAIDYWQDIKPVFDSRCIVCHACYDAPCQLKLTAPEGANRGASKERIYHPERIIPADLTRLFEDAQTVDEWRSKKFFPVLNEFPSSQANRKASLLYQILQLKTHNPLPKGEQLPESLTLGINRKTTCPTIAEFPDFAEDNPLWGMPYGFPALTRKEFSSIEKWLDEGATYTAREPLAKTRLRAVEQWESFFNKNSLKAQISARYLYEHLFIAHLYFSDIDGSQFFKLVRSSTPPGEPVKLIATRRPYSDPGVTRVYYRLVPERETIVAKTHLPYALNAKRRQLWQQLFVEADFSVSTLPDYSATTAGNPFLAFRDIPVNSRYRFLLDEAQFSIMNFIKGPVCRGQTALNVIRDHFWVFFVSPEQSEVELEAEFLEQNLDNLELPIVKGSTYLPLINWHRYSKKQRALQEEKDKFLAQHLESGSLSLDLNLIWNGDNQNPNAALTIFRNFDSAIVEQGLIGAPPKTAWIINYSLLERIHYLLVAGYDVYGNLSHQLLSRLYMDFLRMNGESNFLMLLPEEARNRERQMWYRNADEKTMEFLTNPALEKHVEPNIQYTTQDPKMELYQYLAGHLRGALNTSHHIETLKNHSVARQLARLEPFKGEYTRYLPELSVIRISDGKDVILSTLIKNTAYQNITSMFNEDKNLVESENTISVTQGIIGSYPNAYFDVSIAQLSDFVEQILAIQAEADYVKLLDRYGVRRTTPNFWEFSDSIHDHFIQQQPVQFGYLDYNRFENR